MSRQRLVGLQAERYEHPYDRNALASLKNTSGLETVVKFFQKHSFERLLRIQFTGSNLRVDGDNFSGLHNLLSEACLILDLAAVPDLYIMAGEEINAFTAGVDQPLIVLTAACVDRLTEEELTFVVGHELGHIKSQHVLFRQLASVLPMIGGAVGTVTGGLGTLATKVIESTLLNWERMSELTADRAGLLVCQNANAAVSALAKIAGLPHTYYDQFNVADFIAQARAFEDLDATALNRIAKFISTMDRSHPWTVLRAGELMNWTESGDYHRLCSAYERKALDAGAAPFCSNCGNLILGDDAFCSSCGTPVPAALSSYN